MSMYATAPPTPPATLDFTKALTFVFNDPDWLKKTLLGGLFYVLSFVIVGIFIIFGYLAQLARNVVAGMERPMPEWDNIGGYLVEGLKLFLVSLAWFLPAVVVALLAVIPALMLDDAESAGLGAGLFTCGLGLVFVLALGISLFVPAALVLAAVRQSATAAFEFGTVFRFVRANLMNYVLAIIVYLITNMLSQFGIILLCVGIVFTAFLSMVMTTWAFAETYRLSRIK